MQVIEFKVNKKKKGSCISAISLVDEPAVLVDFLKLNAEKVEIKLSVNEDKMIITGPALIPNQKIYRTAQSLGLEEDGYIFFSAETISEMANMFMSNELQNVITLDHETPNSDLKLLESWVSLDSEKDKSAALGFNLPAGTWYLTYAVNNVDLWKQIKAGKLNGFSIEASGFDRTLIEMAKETEEEITEDEFAEYIFNRIKAIVVH